MKVLLVEDHPTTRFGVRTIVELEEWIEVVGETEGAGEALRLVEEKNPDLVVLDLLLRGEDGGIELCRNLKSLPDPPYVLVYSAYNGPEEIAACRLCGADAYVHKSEDPEQLLDALRSARAGEGKWVTGVEHEDPDALLQEAQEQANLTEREQEVFALLRRRRTDPEIAEELSISPHTVKTHVANVLAKLGYTSRRDLS